MTLEKDNFIIEYDEKLEYIPEVVDYLETKMDDIMSFFELKKLSSKKKIIVYNDLELYKKHMEQYCEYQEYMCADTNDGNINLLSLEEIHKTKCHANMTLEQFKGGILHEFVHICQQDTEIEHIDEIVWFWEALATNLGNPKGFKEIPINASNKDMYEFNYLDKNYSIAYTIGKYMLDNYSHEEILDYVKYPTRLENDSDLILNNVREWSNNKKNKIK